MLYSWHLTVILSALCVAGCRANEAGVYDDIFTKYRPEVRPRINPRDKVDIGLDFELKMIQDLDEKDEVLHTVGYIVARWEDDFLKWIPAKHNGVEHIVTNADKVWLPDFGIENSADDLYRESYFKLFRVTIGHDGSVFWVFGGVFHTMCDLDVTDYPFDEQTCYIRLENWMYSQKTVDLHNDSNVVMVGGYQENGLWDLKETRAEKQIVFYDTNPGVPYAQVCFTLTLARKARYYVVNIVVPSIMLTAVTLLVYILPPDAGEKVSLGVTVLLAFSVFLYVIAENTPVTSDSTPMLGSFIAVQMGMSTLSVVTTVVVLYQHHHDCSTRPPQWLRMIAFNVLGRILRMRIPVVPASEEALSDVRPHSPKSSPSLVVRDDENGERKGSQREQSVKTLEDYPSLAVNSSLREILKHLHRITAHHANMQAKQHGKSMHSAIEEEWRAVARVIDNLLLIVTVIVIVATMIWLLVAAS